MIEPK